MQRSKRAGSSTQLCRLIIYLDDWQHWQRPGHDLLSAEWQDYAPSDFPYSKTPCHKGLPHSGGGGCSSSRAGSGICLGIFMPPSLANQSRECSWKPWSTASNLLTVWAIRMQAMLFRGAQHPHSCLGSMLRVTHHDIRGAIACMAHPGIQGTMLHVLPNAILICQS